MKSIEYQVNQRFQTTNSSCSPTALSVLLDYYGDKIEPSDIESNVPQSRNEEGQKIGSVNQQLATWCIGRGYEVSFYTFDCQVIDQSWSGLEKAALIERLKLRKDGWTVPGMGELWTKNYTQAYIDFLEAGGTLIIKNAVSNELLHNLLAKGPFLPAVSFSTLYGTSRSNNQGETETVSDDINGKASTHSIVVHGVDAAGNYLVADSWKRPGRHSIDPDTMIAAISTAQIECDNLLFQLEPKSSNN